MVRSLASLLGLALLWAAAPAAVAVAQQADNAVRLEQGRELYQAHCALCHQDSGAGNPPTFPALSGNPRLGDLGLIVRAIHRGRGNMPSFRHLSAEDISSVAHYVRNAWANDFVAVSTEAVAAVLEALDETGQVASVWDGIFTEAQTRRGQAAYAGACGTCHGRRLNGAPDDPDMLSTPPLARAKFLRGWEGRSLASLFEYTRATMPESNPGSLTDDEYVDIMAYMLSVSGMPPGDDELRPGPQSLAQIVIEQQQ